VELGAEFVHGPSPELLRIARREHLRLDRLPNEHFERHGGSWRPVRGVWRRFEAATRAMRHGGEDRSVAEVLASRKFPPREGGLPCEMFQGFEAAAGDRLSEQSVSTAGGEPESDAERVQYRFGSGYDAVVESLERSALERGASIRFGAPVRAVAWRRGRV